jgi:integrase
MAKSNLRLVPPATKNGTVGKPPPIRPKNEDLREREHLRPDEIERLIEAARGNRHGGRDALMILMAYRHGLRASEVADLKWEQVDFDRSEIHVNRLKGGTPATHPLTGRELRELRRHKRDSPPAPFVFVSERGAPLTPPGFNRMVKRAAVAAKLGIKARPHAAPRLRLQTHERRNRYPIAAGVPRAQQYPEYRSLHGVGVGAL